MSSSLLAYCQQQTRRSLDALESTVWFYHSLICEKKGVLPTIRPALLAAHRTAVLNRDESGQAIYLNLLLRNYLTPSASGELSLVEQADKLRSQTTFPDSVQPKPRSRQHVVSTAKCLCWGCRRRTISSRGTSTTSGGSRRSSSSTRRR